MKMTINIYNAFFEKLKLHNEWNESGSKYGQLLEEENLDLSGINLSKKDLNSAVLFGAKFNYASLIEVDMYGCYLVSATFRNANLTSANLNKANLDYSHFINTKLINITGIKASFVKGTFNSVNFSGADLRSADFSGANLENVIFRDTNLEKVDFTGARLYNSDFRDAKGVDRTYTKWINIGSEDYPQRLEGDDIINWILNSSK